MTSRCTAKALGLFVPPLAEINVCLASSGKRMSVLSLHPSSSARRSFQTVSSQRPLGLAHFSSQEKIPEKVLHCEPETIEKSNGSSDTTDHIKDNCDDAYVEISSGAVDRLAAEIATELKVKTLSTKIFPVNDEESKELSRRYEKMVSRFSGKKSTGFIDMLRDMPQKKSPRPNTEFSSILNKNKSITGLPNLRLSKLKASQEKKLNQPYQEPWMIEKERIKAKYPDGYMPLKRLSPDAIDGIRALHAHSPKIFTTAMLAEEFKVSPEAIQRILRSKWKPKADEAIDREARWLRRGEKVWSRLADLGATPPSKFRSLGIGQRPRSTRYKPDPLPELITTLKQPKPQKASRSESDFERSML